MSSFLCFICHSTINSDTSEEIREKYKDVVGMHLCPDSHLCYICCYILHKLWLFKSICLKRSLEYPVLFSEKGTLNLHRSETELQTICSNENCNLYQNRNVNSKSYYFSNEDSYNIYENNEADKAVYGSFDNDHTDFEDFINPVIVDQVNGVTVYNDSKNNVDTESFNSYSETNNHYNDGDENSDLNDDLSNVIADDKNEGVNDFNDIVISNEETNVELDTGSVVSTDDLEEHSNEIYNSNLILNNDNKDESDRFETDSKFEVITNEMATPNSQEKSAKKKLKKRKKKKNEYETITLSVEEQKLELDRKRKSKKYVESQFKCCNCALGFFFKDTYQTHMMRHEESNGEYRCDICTLRFASPAVLRAHTKLHRYRYLCLGCGERVTSRRHFSRCHVSGSKIACHLCGRLFQHSSGLQQHLKRFHHKNGGRTYSCSVCGKSYNNQGAVRTHMIKHVNSTFQCGECNSTFNSPYMLNRHKKKHNKIETETHHCIACNVSFKTKQSLMAHLRNTINHQQTIFECPICSRACPNQKSLASHIERVHSSTKNYICPHCPAAYSNRKSLIRHIGSHTKKEEPKIAVCHLCGSRFKGNTKLNRHLKEVCEKDKLEEELSSYYNQNGVIDTDPLLN